MKGEGEEQTKGQIKQKNGQSVSEVEGPFIGSVFFYFALSLNQGKKSYRKGQKVKQKKKFFAVVSFRDARTDRS